MILSEVLPNMYSSPLFVKYAFYASLITQCKILENAEMKYPAGISFSVDKYLLHINVELFNKYSLHHKIGILVHEMHHILSNHIIRGKDKIHEKWNLAADCAINQLIDDNLLPEGCITPFNLTKFPVKSKQTAEYYYNIVDEDTSAEMSHPTWELSDNTDTTAEVVLSVSKQIIDTAIDFTLSTNGTVPVEVLSEIAKRTSTINWKTVLKRIVANKRSNTKKTIYRRNRRQQERLEIKGTKKDFTFRLLVIIDTSGSVSDIELNNLLSEIREICKITNTTAIMIQVDTEASEPEEISKNTKVIKRDKRGGTLLSSGLTKANDNSILYDAVIVTTDGYMSNSDVLQFNIKKKVIWIISKTGKIKEQMKTKNSFVFQLKD